MVQLQIFTTSDYLQKYNCYDNNKKQNHKIFLIGRNDSLVLLLDVTSIQFEKGRNDLTNWLLDIKCNELFKLFADF